MSRMITLGGAHFAGSYGFKAVRAPPLPYIPHFAALRTALKSVIDHHQQLKYRLRLSIYLLAKFRICYLSITILIITPCLPFDNKFSISR